MGCSGLCFTILLKFGLIRLVFCDVSLIEINVSPNETRVITLETQCNPEMIDIKIPRNMTRSGMSGRVAPSSSIIFRSDASEGCQAEPFNEDYYRIKIDLRKRDCGSAVERKTYQTEYKNEVVLVDPENGRVKSLLNFTCVYQNQHEIVLLPSSSSEIAVSANRHGTMKVKMALYRDKSYSKQSKIGKNMPEIPVGHFVFVSLDLSNGLDPTHLITKNCFASYFPTASDKSVVHDFISDGCADRFDSTVAIQSNGDGWTSRWKFQMFKWVNTSSQRIYLFCEVELCDESELLFRKRCDKRDTKENCFGFTYGGRSRRDVSGEDTSSHKQLRHIVSIGPIFPQESVLLLDNSKGAVDDLEGRDDVGKTGRSEALPVTIGVILAFCTVILSIVIYLFCKRRAKRRNEARENTKREIQQGFAFVIKSSNDPDPFHPPPIPQNEGSRRSSDTPSNGQNCVTADRAKTSVHISPSRKTSHSRRTRCRESRRRHSLTDVAQQPASYSRAEKNGARISKRQRSASVEASNKTRPEKSDSDKHPHDSRRNRRRTSSKRQDVRESQEDRP